MAAAGGAARGGRDHQGDRGAGCRGDAARWPQGESHLDPCGKTSTQNPTIDSFTNTDHSRMSRLGCVDPANTLPVQVYFIGNAPAGHFPDRTPPPDPTGAASRDKSLSDHEVIGKCGFQAHFRGVAVVLKSVMMVP